MARGIWFTTLLLIALSLPSLAMAKETEKFILIASSIGPVDAGIVPLLEDRFEQETGIRVRHVAAGTGEALKMAEGGPFDMVLVHARSLEEKFVAKGYGTERIPLMYNDFVIVGPASDPAGIKGSASAAQALKKIRATGATFISRGDKSGTHVAEQELWNKTGVKPEGSWYVIYEKGNTGNGPTLKYTDQRGAYTFMDRATYLTLKDSIKLVVLVEKDDDLINYLSVIPINQKRFPSVNAADTLRFIDWLTAPDKGQKIIAEFGKEKYGTSLFSPNSRQWRAAHPNQ
ncbi:MAG TPA: substrate-binding domain-containing protein [Geomonas sp.]|nr:substrate-binding domain-containing protein [Geomonas sp.]